MRVLEKSDTLVLYFLKKGRLMGKLTNFIKAADIGGELKKLELGSSMKSYISDGMNSMGMPKLKVPDEVKNWKFDPDVNAIKLPAGVDTYISPIAAKAISGFEIPKELGGIPLPELPELPKLSSVIPEVESFFSGLGFNANDLGIRDIETILQNPDLSSLKSVQFEVPVDINNMPDINSAFDEVDLSGIQNDIGSFGDLSSLGISASDFDINKYL